MEYRKKRIVLTFDGTWNNPFQPATREDGLEVLKPSNPLKIARSVLPWDEESQVSQVVYYDTGVGALGEYPGIANWVLGAVDKHFGGALGAGFEANVEQAVTFLVNNYVSGDDVFIFGFSRGAAQARALTHFLDWMGGLPRQQDAYFVPRFFREYLRMKGTGSPSVSALSEVRDFDGQLRRIEITLLGAFDTVMSLSPRFRARRTEAVGKRSFHVKAYPAHCVLNARQALAIDERRFDFKPEIWTHCSDEQSLQQRWFCGVHANVGGGYVNDGLANVAFQWMIDEADSFGLKFDRSFSQKYRAYAQDQIRDSRTKFYRISEFLRMAFNKGKRGLTEHPQSANLNIDASVIMRLHANAVGVVKPHPKMTLYRPENVIELLLQHEADIAGFIDKTGAKPRDPVLPRDILELLGIES